MGSKELIHGNVLKSLAKGMLSEANLRLELPDSKTIQVRVWCSSAADEVFRL